MGFAGIQKDSERADVIGLLATLADKPVPLPTASEVTAFAGPMNFRHKRPGLPAVLFCRKPALHMRRYRTFRRTGVLRGLVS